MLTLPAPLDDRRRAAAARTDHDLRTRVPSLRPPFAATWEDRHRLVVQDGKPWLFGPLESDPYTNRSGGYPLPADVEETLRGLALQGAEFHRIAIAHELDASGPVAAHLEDVPLHGRPITAKQAATFLGRAPATEEARHAARQIDERLRKAGRAARRLGEGAVIAAAAIPASIALDPIIFGVVGIGGLPLAGLPSLYYPLAAWRW